MFEALPPQVEASEDQWQDHLELLDPLRRAGLWGVNVPEIVNGSRPGDVGQYITVEPRSFAAALQRRLGVRAILNRVTVHHTLPQLQSWATQTRMGTGIRDLVLVGGERSTDRHIGPGVEETLAALAPATRKAGGSLGVITIPTRRRADLDEPERLLRKATAGATFAVSQILCEPGAAVRLQEDLAAAAGTKGVKAPTLFWSLAPVARKRDLEFLAWLGVEIPDGYRQHILEPAAPGERVERSHAHNLAVARQLLESAERLGLEVGFCIEHVMLSNIEAAVALVERTRQLCREFPAGAGLASKAEDTATAVW